VKGRVDARVRVTVERARAYAVFTEEIDAWWKRGPRFRFGEGREGRLVLEGRVGGRFLERFAEGDELVVGRVRVWDPPRSFTLALSPPAPGGGEGSEVEVRFTEVAANRTEVHVQHRGLDRLPGDPRTGIRSTALRNVLAVWWADLLGGLRSGVS
jgi:hypothetical protein